MVVKFKIVDEVISVVTSDVVSSVTVLVIVSGVVLVVISASNTVINRSNLNSKGRETRKLRVFVSHEIFFYKSLTRR